jgi:hypothetical protein
MKDLKRKVKKHVSSILAPMINILLHEKLLYLIMRLQPTIINQKSNSFLSLHLRPKKDLEIQGIDQDNSNVGIIIQGPLMEKDDFTLNTIKIYKKLFKNVQIVLSTWDTENKAYLTKIRELNIHVILNEYPENSGILNLNYQLKTTKAAVEYLHGKCEYILKTRTDSRVYNRYSLSYLKNLVHTFPNKGKYNQKLRIVGLDINTAKYVPFSFSDVLQFGHADDIFNVWSTNLVTMNVGYDEFFERKPRVKDIYDFNNPEVYLTLRYLRQIGFKPENTYESYYKALGELFLVIDKEMINYFWYKYSVDEYYWNVKYKNYNLQEKVRFNDWLGYYSQKELTDVEYTYFEENL